MTGGVGVLPIGLTAPARPAIAPGGVASCRCAARTAAAASSVSGDSAACGSGGAYAVAVVGCRYDDLYVSCVRTAGVAPACGATLVPATSSGRSRALRGMPPCRDEGDRLAAASPLATPTSRPARPGARPTSAGGCSANLDGGSRGREDAGRVGAGPVKRKEMASGATGPSKGLGGVRGRRAAGLDGE